MPDVFDTLAPDKPDVFDQISPDKQDVFDKIQPPDIFDQIAPDNHVPVDQAALMRSARTAGPISTLTGKPMSELGAPTDPTATLSEQAKSLWQAANEPGYNVRPPPSEVEFAKQSKDPDVQKALGVRQAVDDFFSSFTSPIGVATLGIGKLPSFVGRLVSLGYSAMAAKQAGQDLGTLAGSPPKDPTEASKLKMSALLNTLALGGLGAHAAAPEPGAAAVLADTLDNTKPSPDLITPQMVQDRAELMQRNTRTAPDAGGQATDPVNPVDQRPVAPLPNVETSTANVGSSNVETPPVVKESLTAEPKPIATVGDAIGQKLDELKALIARDKNEPLDKSGGSAETVQLPQETQSSKKITQAISDYEHEFNSAQLNNKSVVEHNPANEDGPETWSIYSKAKGNDRSASVYERNGSWYAEDGNGSNIGGEETAVGGKVPETGERVASLPDRAISYLEEQANRARQRINNRSRTTFGAGPLHELPNIADWAIVGAHKLATGVRDVVQWSADMVSDFGDAIKPHLEAVYRAAADRVAGTAAEIEGLGPIESIVGQKIPNPREETIEVKPSAAQKTVLRAAEKSGAAGRAAGIKQGVEMERNVPEHLSVKERITQSAEQQRPITETRNKTQALQDVISDSVSKAKALRQYFSGQEKSGAAGRANAREELAQADRWLEADANNVRQSLTDLANSSLPLAERGRFLKSIADATKRPPILSGDSTAMYERAATVAARVQARAEEVHKNAVADEIKDTVKKSLASPSVDLGYKTRISNLMKRISFTKPTESIVESLQATRDFINRMATEGKSNPVPEEIVKRLNLLGNTPLRDLPTVVLESILDKVNALAKLGQLKIKSRQAVWEIEKNQKTEALVAEQTTPVEVRREFRPQPGEKYSFSMKFWNKARNIANVGNLFDKGLLPMDAVFDLLGRGKATYDGWLFRHMRGPLDADYNLTLNDHRTAMAGLDEIVKCNILNEQNFERIGTYAMNMQEGGRTRLIEQGVLPAVIDNITHNLSPAEHQAYDYMRRAMDLTLPHIQELMHELYNIEVKPERSYFPMQRDSRLIEKPTGGTVDPETGKEITLDKAAAQDWVRDTYSRPTTKAEQGMTIERKGGKTAVKINAYELFNQHMRDVAHLLNAQRDLKMIGEIVRSDTFRQKYGDFGQKVVLDWLDTVARQGGVDSAKRWAALDSIRNRLSIGEIALRLSSNVVHASQSAIAAAQIGPIWYAKGLIAATTPEGRAFLAKNFSEISERGSSEIGIYDLDHSKTPFGKLGYYGSKIGFALARYIDKYQAEGATLGAYLKAMSEKGISPDQALTLPPNNEAAAWARVKARRSVASPAPQDAPQALSRGALTGGNVSIGRSMFQFGNIFLDQWSNIRLDMMKAGIWEKNPQQAAKIFLGLLAATLGAAGIKYGVKHAINSSTGSPDKKDDLKNDVEREFLNKIPFVGQLSQMYLYGESGIPVVDAPIKSLHELRTAQESKQPNTKTRHYIAAAGQVAALAGIPGAGQISDVADKEFPKRKAIFK